MFDAVYYDLHSLKRHNESRHYALLGWYDVGNSDGFMEISRF